MAVQGRTQLLKKASQLLRVKSIDAHQAHANKHKTVKTRFWTWLACQTHGPLLTCPRLPREHVWGSDVVDQQSIPFTAVVCLGDAVKHKQGQDRVATKVLPHALGIAPASKQAQVRGGTCSNTRMSTERTYLDC